jgi:hypothetical protein
MQPQSLSEKPAEAKASRGKILFFPPWGFFLSTMVERKKPHGGKNKQILPRGLAIGKKILKYRSQIAYDNPCSFYYLKI